MTYGKSTDHELRKLTDKYPSLKENDIIYDSTIESLINIDRKAPRFHTVVERWKRYLMRNYNLLLERYHDEEGKKGYQILNASGRLEHVSKRQKRAENQIKRAFVVLGTTRKEDLPDEQKPYYDHYMGCLSHRIQWQLEEKRTLKMLPPVPVEKKQ